MAASDSQRYLFTVEADEAGMRLDELLAGRLGDIFAGGDGARSGQVSKAKLRRLVLSGAVSLNGKPVYTAAVSLKAGGRVNVFLDTARFFDERRPDDIALELTEKDILFEDEWLIALDKPAGIPTEGTIVASRDSVHAALSRFLSGRAGSGGQAPYAGLHHRLDRETSGVLLFTKAKEANAAVHAMFESHVVIKIYEALCARPAGRMPAEFSVSNRLDRVSAASARALWGEVKEGGLAAETRFRTVAEYAEGARVKAFPRTGRTHQIRVHLAGRGMPILGDGLYGGPTAIGSYRVPRVMLHAGSLEFPHPIDGKPIAIRSPLPADFVACLKRLESGRAGQARGGGS